MGSLQSAASSSTSLLERSEPKNTSLELNHYFKSSVLFIGVLVHFFSVPVKYPSLVSISITVLLVLDNALRRPFGQDRQFLSEYEESSLADLCDY